MYRRWDGVINTSGLLKTHNLILAIEEPQLNMFYQILKYLGKVYFLSICCDIYYAYKIIIIVIDNYIIMSYNYYYHYHHYIQ